MCACVHLIYDICDMCVYACVLILYLFYDPVSVKKKTDITIC